MSPNDLLTFLIAIFGGGGITTIIIKYMDGRNKAKLTEIEAASMEVKAAADTAGVDVVSGKWDKLTDDLSAQNDALWKQNRILLAQNSELTQQTRALLEQTSELAQQNTALKEQNRLLQKQLEAETAGTKMAFEYIDLLRTHIEKELPPPPPDWPYIQDDNSD